ncbi:hypothetical protein B0A55_07183 [Friedmanniomyces simplex]|uniref:Protein kinase domain-containing protein n=1 Tax=Friedmanniomyces simplex TaxID=329884 RepID=A0A4U0XC46_9PEZI|nr:hypothetical protein B0A55_07183 [Friedmanniomyces simplex]
MEDEDISVVFYTQYCPPGVRDIIANGTDAFVGKVDEFTVLKYPALPGGDLHLLEHEYRVFKHVGPHPRIIAAKDFNELGLYLERAPNGTLNILLDKDLDVKLADLQCNHVSDEGEIIWFGERGEPCRFYCPRGDEIVADVRTDLFALGSTIYFIMLGYEVFPDIISGHEGWHDMVASRFERGEFPNEPHLCAGITKKCWRQEYRSVDEVLNDIVVVERQTRGAADGRKSSLEEA